METVKFEEGKIYQMRFIGDSDLKVNHKCTGRTAKMATFEVVGRPKQEILRKKINLYSGVEYIKAGSYSMAPTIYADKLVTL